MEKVDYVVIGGGMAGISVASELAAGASVIVVERETAPGYHTTGRSAALFSETYGNATIRGLSMGGRGFYMAPPDGFTESAMLSPRGALFIARADQIAARDALVADVDDAARMDAIDAAAACRHVPLLRRDYVAAAAYEPDAMDIDVNALLQGYIKQLRARGGRLITDAEVRGLDLVAGAWHVDTAAGQFAAPIVINAAGAWADTIGSLAGAAPIGLVPKRRTVIIFDPPAGTDTNKWPLTVDIDEEFYFKPDAGRLLGSPADETPSEPCDAQPEELDIAIAVDRIETASELKVRRVLSKWAGLRSFVSDKTPVAGFDGGRPGFFWLAGQGGYGIQTAPGLSRAAAALAGGRAMPADLQDFGVSESALSPGRLR